jgi:hypothetical protein
MMNYCFIFECREGRIARVREYMDTMSGHNQIFRDGHLLRPVAVPRLDPGLDSGLDPGIVPAMTAMGGLVICHGAGNWQFRLNH